MSSRAFRAELDLERDDMIAFFDGKAKSEAPILATWAMGSAKPSDVIWTTYANPLLMSERVVEVLRQGRFTGWDVMPVELRGKDRALLPPYYFMSIHGRAGPIDNERYELFHEQLPGGLTPMRRGLYFDPTTWDGSDIFAPDTTGFICVVEPVKRALTRAKVKNLMFTPLDRIERMFY